MANKNDSPLTVILAGIERLFLAVIIGLGPPILLGLAGWQISLQLAPETGALPFVLGGLMAGVLLDVVFLRRWVRNALQASLIWLALVYLVYSAGALLFFIQLPVFNFLLGPIGGYTIGMRLRSANAPKAAVERVSRLTGFFTAMVFAAACASALLFAPPAVSPQAALGRIFSLVYPLDKSTILIITTLMGSVLVILEYLGTRATVKFARFLDQV